MVRDYNTSRTWSWTPAIGEIGTYAVQVWARRQGSGANWEAWASADSSYQVALVPLSVTLTSDQGDPPVVPANTKITWRAIVTGATGPVGTDSGATTAGPERGAPSRDTARPIRTSGHLPLTKRA